MNKKEFTIFSIAVFMTSVFFISIGAQHNPEQIIINQNEAIIKEQTGKEVKYVGIVDDEEDPYYKMQQFEDDNYLYFYDPDEKYLNRIMAKDDYFIEGSFASEDEMRDSAKCLFEAVMGEYILGDLEIRPSSLSSYGKVYELIDHCNSLETGTKGLITYANNGTLVNGVFIKGNDTSLLSEDSMLAELEALEFAEKAIFDFEEQNKEIIEMKLLTLDEEYSAEIGAFRKNTYWRFWIPVQQTLSNQDTKIVYYLVKIHVLDGTVVDLQRSLN